MSDHFVFLGRARELKQQRIEALAGQYQSFDSVEMMDKHLGLFVEQWGLQLGDTALRVLEFLCRHSLKVIGVSWLSTRTLAGLVGVSERTIQRILGKLEDLGIIRRIVTVRADGGQGANLVVIQPVEDADEIPDSHESATAAEVITAMEQIAIASSVAGYVTGDNRGDVAGYDTQNLLNLEKPSNLKINDDDEYKSYRFREFFNMAEERNIPREAAELIFPFIKTQLLKTSWVALILTFDKLKRYASSISSIGPWFASTLANENLLQRISCA